MGGRAKAIVLHAKDNVATALEALKAGTAISLELQGRVERVELLSDIPMGHKFALRPVERGEAVIKYGEPIGRSTARIARGAHVHVHNVASGPGKGGRG